MELRRVKGQIEFLVTYEVTDDEPDSALMQAQREQLAQGQPSVTSAEGGSVGAAQGPQQD